MECTDYLRRTVLSACLDAWIVMSQTSTNRPPQHMPLEHSSYLLPRIANDGPSLGVLCGQSSRRGSHHLDHGSGTCYSTQSIHPVSIVCEIPIQPLPLQAAGELDATFSKGYDQNKSKDFQDVRAGLYVHTVSITHTSKLTLLPRPFLNSILIIPHDNSHRSVLKLDIRGHEPTRTHDCALSQLL